ncbi:sarcosine oxidase subunit alpha [Brenneria roseae subsp. roseae]|uniref:(2Fe-2S)-binding protein n=1 Tax=Brenneria roseae TaxID=1509241 RepID=UPI000D60F0D1|nr:(2Fe-2S)-binding protein [Brenneria roseae]PWC19960.1 sarcosine oxidase subunit alpha [Brenneria roseae subsp. roseae]
MSSDLFFHPLPSVDATFVTIWVNGNPLPARSDWTIAAALLANGLTACRTTAIDAQPRGPFCMMGSCFECRVTVDDVPNIQACMTPVRAGMHIAFPQGARTVQ